jgi:two-component system chemotaxis response regulator CheB
VTTRVLVVDDSVVARKVIASILVDAGFDVVGTAATGAIALAKIPRLDPDIVTLDLDMPEMDGLEALSEIRRRFPSVRVVMVSNHTERGASATVEALFRGASDYVTKATRASTAAEAREEVAAQLVPKLRSLVTVPTRPVVTPATVSEPTEARPVAAVGIAASTGGPKALAALLRELPADLPVPVLVVQHMPESFTAYLAERLDAQCAPTIREAADGDRPGPGGVWIAPGSRHLEVRRTDDGPRFVTTSDPAVNSCRPSADVLFRSMVECWGAGVLAAVLTGMGQDGLRGAEAIRRAGGRVIAQDRPSSVVWGMPGQVVGAGLSDLIAPPDQLGREIVRRVRESRS